MLPKYLTQSKIRLIVKAPVVILSVLRKTYNVLLTFVLAVHTNCRLYSLKQKLLLSCAVFRKNFVDLILFQSFVLQSYFKGQWKFPSHIKAYKNPRHFPTSTGSWVSAVWIVHCYYIKQSQTVTGPKTLSSVKQLYTAQQLGVRRSLYSVQKIYIRLDMIGHVHR